MNSKEMDWFLKGTSSTGSQLLLYTRFQTSFPVDSLEVFWRLTNALLEVRDHVHFVQIKEETFGLKRQRRVEISS